MVTRLFVAEYPHGIRWYDKMKNVDCGKQRSRNQLKSYLKEDGHG